MLSDQNGGAEFRHRIVPANQTLYHCGRGLYIGFTLVTTEQIVSRIAMQHPIKDDFDFDTVDVFKCCNIGVPEKASTVSCHAGGGKVKKVGR